MNVTRVGMVGTGWRARFMLTVLQALPERFAPVGVVCRSEAGRERALAWGVTPLASHETLADLAPDFVLLCADKAGMGPLMRWYAHRDIPVLAETFMTENVEALRALYGDLHGARVQVAEQYMHQPLNAARIACVESGLLGEVYQVQTSIPNGYHAVSVQRRLLGTGYARPVVRANRYSHRMLGGPGRQGDPTEEAMVTAGQVLFQLDYDGRETLNDVEDNQHRSFFRTQHFVARGTRGEIRGEDVLYMRDAVTPCHFALERVMAGAGPNLEGLYLRGVRGGDHGWYYYNGFMPARLTDDELAAAACLIKMADFARGGPSFYPLREAVMDIHLAMMVQAAIEAGTAIGTPAEAWTD